MDQTTTAIDPKLLTKLRSKKADVREAAERQIAAMGPEAVDGLLELLEKESATRAKRRKIGIAVVCCYIALFVMAALTDHAKFIGNMGGMTGIMIALFAATQAQKDAARVLARYDNKRGVGRLAEALDYNDKHVLAEVEPALIRLLPKLIATDHALLSLDQRRSLDKAIVKRGKAPLALAVLDAYEQIGDPDSVEVVERMAKGEVRRLDAAVVERAREVLPAMRVRAEAVHAAQTLLRPVEVADADMLLRPVESGPSGPVETLVRPVGADADFAVAADAEAELADRHVGATA
ncbi:MAG: hypothetical protein FJX72_12235 [Armatimonadetes bacterium]|nr:hypothetical protein [Armatimonadota bacterium]